MDAIAQLALMSKADQVFGDPNNPEIFLSFPFTYPIAYKPEDLDFAHALLNPTLGHTLADLSLNVNSLPTGTLFQGVGDKYLWDAYEQWLSDMVLAKDQMTSEERAQYDQATALLTIKDSNGFSVDSPIVVAYKQYRDAWFAAEQNYKNDQITAINSSDPAVQSQWKDIDEPRLRALVEQATSDWEIKGDKAEVEAARALKARLDARSPSTGWDEWNSALIKDIDMPTDPVSNMSYAPTGFSPADLFAQDWPPFTLTKDEIAQLAQSAPDELRNIFATGSGASPITSLSFQFRSAALVRPWLSTDVFKARFWNFRDGTPPLSDGAASPQGSWPAYISAVVLARNIVVTTQNAPRPQYLHALAVSEAILSAETRARVVRDHRTEATEPSSATIRDHRTDPTRVGSETIRPFSGGFASSGAMARRTMTPMFATATAPQISKVSPFTRLVTATYRLPTQVFQPGTVSTGASSDESSTQPEASTADSNVSILAFICRRLPHSPNPDPALTW
jgi:hypothetical protein